MAFSAFEDEFEDDEGFPFRPKESLIKTNLV